jgi:NADH dehydrogenase
MNIRTVCVLGGTGFVGRQIVARLEARGCRIKVITRRRARHRELLVLPRLELIEGDVHDPQILARHFAGCDAVINLIGILNERGHDGSGFRRVHVELPKKVLETCKQAGVRRIIHMSGLNADAGSGSSHYLRSKGEAENHLHTFAGDIAVTSFRPSVIFGPGDSFLNRFAALLRLSPLVFPLTCPNARFQPVFVGDVADAFVDALDDKASYGQRRDLCGPKAYTLKELVGYTAQTIGLRRWVIGLPDGVSRLIAFASEYLLPGKFFSQDNYNSMRRDSVCSGGDPCPTALESVAPYFLGGNTRDSRYQRWRARARR